MREVERGEVSAKTASETVLRLSSKYSTSSSTNKFCPGLCQLEYDSYKEIIRFEECRITTEPFYRISYLSVLID